MAKVLLSLHAELLELDPAERARKQRLRFVSWFGRVKLGIARLAPGAVLASGAMLASGDADGAADSSADGAAEAAADAAAAGVAAGAAVAELLHAATSMTRAADAAGGAR